MLDILTKKASPCSLEVVKVIKDTISASPIYKGNVYLGGETVLDMILGRPIKHMKVFIRSPKGGISFPTWIAAKTGDLTCPASINIDAKNVSSTLHLAINPAYGDITLHCTYTRKNCSAPDSSIPVYIYGTVEEEAKLSSCTATSLLYDITEDKLIDITGKGMVDIEHGLIRCVDDANRAIARNPELIFKLATLKGNTGWGFEKDTWMALVTHSRLVFNMTMLEIKKAFHELILADRAGDSIMSMMHMGVLKYICHTLNALKDIQERKVNGAATVLEHTARVMNLTKPIPELRLAAMMHDAGKLNSVSTNFMFHASEGKKSAEKVLSQMGYDNKTIERAATIIARHEDFEAYKSNESIPSDGHVRRFFKKCNNDKELAYLALDLIYANNAAKNYGRNLAIVGRVKAKIDKVMAQAQLDDSAALVPITGDDIMKEYNLKSGRFIGDMIRKMRMTARKENRALSKEECFQMVKAALHEAEEN